MRPLTLSRLFVLLLLLISVEGITQHTGGKPRAAVHGMVIFGSNTVYAYHLPMFHSPHDYQVIFELSFDKETMLNLKRDQQLNVEHATYTIEPPPFILPDMIKNPKPFSVNIYRGHFERGGVKIFSNVKTEIVKVLYSEQLLPGTKRSETAKFIVFGNAKEQFAAHLLANNPDFDQIIQTNVDASLLKDQNYLIVDFPASENSPIGISGNAINGFTDRPVKMILLKQIYLEFDDLK